MQHREVVGVLERPEHMALGSGGVGQQPQRLVGMGRDHHVGEGIELTIRAAHGNQPAGAGEPLRGTANADVTGHLQPQCIHIGAAAALHGAPLLAVEDLQQPVARKEPQE